MSMKLHHVNGTLCEQCGNRGTVLLDPTDSFTVAEDGTIDFPEGEWGIDIFCDCPACGFGARLGDFFEWVEEQLSSGVSIRRCLWPFPATEEPDKPQQAAVELPNGEGK